MHSAIKRMQITTEVDQIIEGNISMQRVSWVLKRTSSRAQKPAAQKGIEHSLEAFCSCPLVLLAERLQVQGVHSDNQGSADIWLLKTRGGGKRL